MNLVLAIDPNVRIEGNETYTGFEDLLDGDVSDLREGVNVTVREPESGLIGSGTVSVVDHLRQLVYLSVDWKSLRPSLAAALRSRTAV